MIEPTTPVCRICGGPISQSPVTGGWFHIEALPYVHGQPLTLHHVQPAVTYCHANNGVHVCGLPAHSEDSRHECDCGGTGYAWAWYTDHADTGSKSKPE